MSPQYLAPKPPHTFTPSSNGTNPTLTTVIKHTHALTQACVCFTGHQMLRCHLPSNRHSVHICCAALLLPLREGPGRWFPFNGNPQDIWSWSIKPFLLLWLSVWSGWFSLSRTHTELYFMSLFQDIHKNPKKYSESVFGRLG